MKKRTSPFLIIVLFISLIPVSTIANSTNQLTFEKKGQVTPGEIIALTYSDPYPTLGQPVHLIITVEGKSKEYIIFFKLLENNEFKSIFINRFADCINTIFKPDVVTQRIHEMKAVLEPEMPNHIVKWGGGPTDWTNIKSMDYWNNDIQMLETFVEQRPDTLYSLITEQFGLSGTANVNLAVSFPEAGKIKINSMINR